LQWLGLRKSMAQIFAEECTTAVAARQAVFLQGAFAVQVARALARAVGARVSASVTPPIGVQDGAGLRAATDEAFSADGDCVGVLVVEGINHVPLDVTKEIISDWVCPSIHAAGFSGRRVAVFATLSRGVASLPIEPQYFELGPVFDLDYLEWRTNVP